MGGVDTVRRDPRRESLRSVGRHMRSNRRTVLCLTGGVSEFIKTNRCCAGVWSRARVYAHTHICPGRTLATSAQDPATSDEDGAVSAQGLPAWWPWRRARSIYCALHAHVLKCVDVRADMLGSAAAAAPAVESTNLGGGGIYLGAPIAVRTHSGHLHRS